MTGLCAPLPTLRLRPRERKRTAWGRCGSLLLHRIGLAPITPCRSPGAQSPQLHQEVRASQHDFLRQAFPRLAAVSVGPLTLFGRLRAGPTLSEEPRGRFEFRKRPSAGSSRWVTALEGPPKALRLCVVSTVHKQLHDPTCISGEGGTEPKRRARQALRSLRRLRSGRAGSMARSRST
jgi:hypothetical protein